MGETDTAWKLTKKHQHQVKLLLLQPAYEARGARQDKSKVALDIVVVIWNSSKGQEGGRWEGRHVEAQTECNLNARNIWTRLLSALFDCAQLFKKVFSPESRVYSDDFFGAVTFDTPDNDDDDDDLKEQHEQQI